MNMPSSQNRSNCAFRCGFLCLATTSTAKSGLNRIQALLFGRSWGNQGFSDIYKKIKVLGRKMGSDSK